MQITETTIGEDITVLALEGRLTLGRESQALEWSIQKMVEAGRRKLILDLSALDYVDSAGLGIIIGSATAARQAGGGLRLANPGERVRHVFEITSTDKVLSIDPDVATAATKL